jgi:hypothetical protein
MDENVQANYEYLNPRKIPSIGEKWCRNKPTWLDV